MADADKSYKCACDDCDCFDNCDCDDSPKIAKISVYVNNGAIYSFELKETDSTPENACDVVQDIIEGGYVHNDGMGLYEWYPASRIMKVRVSGIVIPTDSPDVDEGV